MMFSLPVLTRTLVPSLNSVLTGTLYEHLSEIETAAQSRIDLMLPKLAAEAGATETLKATDPMKWTGLMNSCKAQAEEIVLSELIYN